MPSGTIVIISYSSASVFDIHILQEAIPIEFLQSPTHTHCEAKKWNTLKCHDKRLTGTSWYPRDRTVLGNCLQPACTIREQAEIAACSNCYLQCWSRNMHLTPMTLLISSLWDAVLCRTTKGGTVHVSTNSGASDATSIPSAWAAFADSPSSFQDGTMWSRALLKVFTYV